MTTEVPEHLYAVSPVNDLDAQTKATHRLAQAIEQLTLAILDKSLPANLQATTLAPLPPVTAPPVAPVTASFDGCPIHHQPWKVVPAGVSKKTGKSYSAFKACSVAGCDQRPRV